MNKNIFLLLLMVLLFSCAEKKKPATSAHSFEEQEGLHLSAQQMQLGHIVTDSIRIRALGEELMLPGILVPDQNNLTSVSTRVMGRIERLYIKNIGEEIKIGQPIYDIYSEELNMASKELKLALEKKKLDAVGVDMGKIIDSARKKLALYGLSSKQIKDIENKSNFSSTLTILSPGSGTITSIGVNEGDYLMEGKSIYTIADLTTLWAEAQVYSDNMSVLSENMDAILFVQGMPRYKESGKISFINPELNPSSKINIVRMEIPNNSNRLRPGTQINLAVLLSKKNVLAVATDAILLDQKGASVWVKTGDNHFKSVMVKTGIESNEYTEITSGLKHGDVIVTSGAYLLNSEYLFKKGTNPMEGHDMSNM